MENVMTAVKTHFQVEESLSALRKSSDLFAELFTDKNITIEIYKPDQEDFQAPHDRDELYIVISGCGDFRMNEEIVQFKTGDLLLAPQGVAHRFENFTDDFATWVIFYGPRKVEKEEKWSS
jgi:mannose-6-phosphate isomerase-like protein (cupin superfamily)